MNFLQSSIIGAVLLEKIFGEPKITNNGKLMQNNIKKIVNNKYWEE